jgi:hypothetical protein
VSRFRMGCSEPGRNHQPTSQLPDTTFHRFRSRVRTVARIRLPSPEEALGAAQGMSESALISCFRCQWPFPVASDLQRPHVYVGMIAKSQVDMPFKALQRLQRVFG